MLKMVTKRIRKLPRDYNIKLNKIIKDLIYQNLPTILISRI